MPLIKVTDPTKILTDTLLISQLEKQGIYQDEVEFTQDYAMPAVKDGIREKGKSPYAKFYKHLNSRSRFMVSSGLPMCDYKGQLLDVGFIADSGGYRAKTNVFDSFVTLSGQVTAGCLNDQPDGRKSGQISRWSPTLYLGKKEIKPSSPKLLEIDPLNENYKLNVLEWDYGICKRRIRLIEGRTLGTWEFPTNPNGEVRIVYNQSGDFLVKLGMYAVNPNEERIPADVFNYAQYPFTVGDSQTFYPDAHTETSSVDGYASRINAADDWATKISSDGTNADDTVATSWVTRFQSAGVDGLWNGLFRGILLFDTSGLQDTAIITAATLSIRGASKTDNLTVTPDINIYSSNPASNTAVAAGDFDSLGSTAFSTAITYANWLTSATFNDFILNASGLAAITVTGVSKFGARNANYDVSGTPPAWSSSKVSELKCYNAEQGDGYKPKLVVTYTAPQTYDETGRTQVVNAVVGHSNNQIMKESREQVILATQGGNAVRHYYETALVQVIKAAAGKSEQLTMMEARGQAIPVVIGKIDLQTMIEARGQAVTVAQGHSDAAIFNELGHSQVILAAMGNVVGLKYSELLGQVINAVTGESENLIFTESVLQEIKIALGKSESMIMADSPEQVILVHTGESDNAIFYENAVQTILAMLGQSVGFVIDETGKLTLIRAIQGHSSSAIFTENRGQLVIVVHGELDYFRRILSILSSLSTGLDITSTISTGLDITSEVSSGLNITSTLEAH